MCRCCREELKKKQTEVPPLYTDVYSGSTAHDKTNLGAEFIAVTAVKRLSDDEVDCVQKLH